MTSHPGGQRTPGITSTEERPAATRWSLSGRGLPATKAMRRRSLGADRLVEREASEAAAARNALSRRLLATADVLSATLAFVLVVSLVGNDRLGLYSLIAIPMIVVVCKLCGLYDRDEYLLSKTTLDEAPALFWVATLYTLLAFLAGDALVSGHFGRDQAVFLWGLLFFFMVGFRYLARRAAAALSQEERCVILGNAHAANWLVAKLERSHRTDVEVVGRVRLRPEDPQEGTLAELGTLDNLESLVRDRQIDRVLVARGRGDPDHEVLKAIRIAKRLGVYVTVLPRTIEVLGAAVEFDDLEGTTLLAVRRHGLSKSSRLIKRSFDLVGAIAGLFLLAPLMAIIAVAIKLDSRGSIFFGQPRVGRGDRTFRIYKFRTMVEGADSQRAVLADRNEAAGGLFKIEDDPRMTRAGKFLRRTSLDELPQLINVVRGDMSLVGPRPLVLDEDERIEGWERFRMMLPPGVTGMWQILGSARVPMTEMVKIDYLYGANWSLWLDIKILLRTIPFVVGRRGL